MSDIRIENAKITGTWMGFDTRGLEMICPSISFEQFGRDNVGWAQAYGGWGFADERLLHHFLRNILETFEVERWEDLKGKKARLKVSGIVAGTKIVAIGHATKDKWFAQEEMCKQLGIPCS